ncbi:LIVCS family branched-chain amino acid:cation transporter [Sinobacterium caligoides]|uniref:Branched-chain amino acid transport system carrier protein n=1 Tax=Sinobacterium caligoides TaxID=933926 RepID=A0A3N2E185_9GAMM|nr:branched-chain amino acid transport system II carrier protein [Sinobacterium caligoides]ROS05787.1 LIVCS family branched-chain amino acid:cation transporter [Sinobacterium caligoides]
MTVKVIKSSDIAAVGLMTFALFLGAGNLIFPPTLGQMAGDQLWVSMLGFLITGVGLPLLGITACAILGGGLGQITQHLPKSVALIFTITIYLAIGPLFGTPRTGLVAYEFTLGAALGDHGNHLTLGLFTAAFFGVSLWLALYPGKLVDTIGKVITPLLILVLTAISFVTIVFPQGELAPASAKMQDAAFSQGFIQGYQTMDTLAAIVFGLVIINALRSKGIEKRSELTRYTIYAGLMAAVGLSFIYLILGYLGATSGNVAEAGMNGAQIISAYIEPTLGTTGHWLLGITMALACLSTAIGLIVACGEYFEEIAPRFSYRFYAVCFAVLSAIVANIGLNELLAITIPALLISYPVAICLIALSFIQHRFSNPQRAYLVVLIPITLLSFVDGLSHAKLNWALGLQKELQHLPLQAEGLGWVVPAAILIVFCLVFFHRQRPQ